MNKYIPKPRKTRLLKSAELLRDANLISQAQFDKIKEKVGYIQSITEFKFKDGEFVK